MLKATVPKSVDHWGFRLQRGLVYEAQPRAHGGVKKQAFGFLHVQVKKGGWAEAVSLRLGACLRLGPLDSRKEGAQELAA